MAYDPEIRKSKHGARLYETWKRVRKHGYDPVFEKYPDFYAWAIKTGYAIGRKLARHDPKLPHSPRNSYWKSQFAEDEITAEWAVGWCKKWDDTVNKLRRQWGLPPLKGGKS